MLIKVVDEIKLLKEQIDLINGNEISVGKEIMRSLRNYFNVLGTLNRVTSRNQHLSATKMD